MLNKIINNNKFFLFVCMYVIIWYYCNGRGITFLDVIYLIFVLLNVFEDKIKNS